jgi:glycosyltransferase involved in cell wall biosynthesis
MSAEVLIWDNFSNDGTLDWLLEYRKIDNRISEVFCSNENYGVEAINFLANRAKGEYILKIDDDIVAPPGFAQRLVESYEKFNDPRLAYLGFDMRWDRGTFATRSGMKLYKPPMGISVRMKNGDKLLVHYTPKKWMVNGACRLSKKSTFIELGGHPQGFMYGVDYAVSKAAAEAGYWIGYLSCKHNLDHIGRSTPQDIHFKHKELKKAIGIDVQRRVQAETQYNFTHA